MVREQVGRLGHVPGPAHHHVFAQCLAQLLLGEGVGVEQQNNLVSGDLDVAALFRPEHPGRTVQGQVPSHQRGIGDGVQQHLVVPGLLDEAEHLAGVDRVHDVGEVREAGEQQAHGVGRLDPGLLQEFGAGHSGHAMVADDDFKRQPAQARKTFLRIGCGGHRELAPEQPLQRAQHVGIVVHAEHMGLGDADVHAVPLADRGRKTRKRVPTPSWVSTSILPPCWSTTSLVMASPRPVPSSAGLVVK